MKRIQIEREEGHYGMLRALQIIVDDVRVGATRSGRLE